MTSAINIQSFNDVIQQGGWMKVIEDPTEDLWSYRNPTRFVNDLYPNKELRVFLKYKEDARGGQSMSLWTMFRCIL